MDQMEGKGRHRFRLRRAKKALVQAPLPQAVTVEGIGILEDGVDFLPCGIVLTTMTGDEVTPRLVVTVMKADGSEGLRMKSQARRLAELLIIMSRAGPVADVKIVVLPPCVMEDRSMGQGRHCPVRDMACLADAHGMEQHPFAMALRVDVDIAWYVPELDPILHERFPLQEQLPHPQRLCFYDVFGYVHDDLVMGYSPALS